MQTVVLERFQAVGVFCVHDLEVYCVELFPESAQSDHVSLNKKSVLFSCLGTEARDTCSCSGVCL